MERNERKLVHTRRWNNTRAETLRCWWRGLYCQRFYARAGCCSASWPCTRFFYELSNSSFLKYCLRKTPEKEKIQICTWGMTVLVLRQTWPGQAEGTRKTSCMVLAATLFMLLLSDNRTLWRNMQRKLPCQLGRIVSNRMVLINQQLASQLKLVVDENFTFSKGVDEDAGDGQRESMSTKFL